MKRHPVLVTIGILLLISVLISFPFFKIKYFETLSALEIVYCNFLIPILITATLGTTLAYCKFLRKFNKKTTSKVKVVLQDIFTVTFLSCILSAILVGLTFSTIVTTNAYLKPRKTLMIKEPVIAYEPNRTKWGRLRHYIQFPNPVDKSVIHLEVYKKYDVGEIFMKEMKIGKWGLLYSMN